MGTKHREHTQPINQSNVHWPGTDSKMGDFISARFSAKRVIICSLHNNLNAT